MSEAALILLAAGGSTRMGASKQLLEYGGQPLLRHAAEVALASACRPVIVVLGAQAERVRSAVDGLPVEVADNPRWEEGMGTSIHAGLRALLRLTAAPATLGVVLALADQPLVTPSVFDRLVSAHRQTGKPVVASRYSGTVGVPAFFAAELFPELLALEPAAGCKRVILADAARTFLRECPEAAADVDTPEEYARLTLPTR